LIIDLLNNLIKNGVTEKDVEFAKKTKQEIYDLLLEII
jgi:hypothetical protein